MPIALSIIAVCRDKVNKNLSGRCSVKNPPGILPGGSQLQFVSDFRGALASCAVSLKPEPFYSKHWIHLLNYICSFACTDLCSGFISRDRKTQLFLHNRFWNQVKSELPVLYMGLTSNAVFQPVLPVLQGGRPFFLRTTFSPNLYIVRVKAASAWIFPVLRSCSFPPLLSYTRCCLYYLFCSRKVVGQCAVGVYFASVLFLKFIPKSIFSSHKIIIFQRDFHALPSYGTAAVESSVPQIPAYPSVALRSGFSIRLRAAGLKL